MRCPSFAQDTSRCSANGWRYPLVSLAGSTKIGDEFFNEIFHPIAVRLLEKCDAVLRVGGPSAGADEMVRVGTEPGIKDLRQSRGNSLSLNEGGGCGRRGTHHPIFRL